MYTQKMKPANIGWTLAWRKGHKKLTTLSGGRKRVRRRVRATRAIVGLNSEEIKKRKTTNYHTVSRSAAGKEIKGKKKKKMKKQFGMSKGSRSAMNKGSGHAAR